MVFNRFTWICLSSGLFIDQMDTPLDIYSVLYRFIKTDSIVSSISLLVVPDSLNKFLSNWSGQFDSAPYNWSTITNRPAPSRPHYESMKRKRKKKKQRSRREQIAQQHRQFPIITHCYHYLVYYYSNQAEDTISFFLIFKWINNTVQYYNIV